MAARIAFSRERIVAAARQVIRERGYARATTKEIARVAGCSEGTLYNHFSDKEELFVVCTLDEHPEVLDLIGGLTARAGRDPLRDVLRELLRALADLHRELVPVLASMWADPELVARHKAVVHDQLPDGLRNGPVPPIAAYVAAEQAVGRMRADLDPTTVATTLLSVPFAHAIWDHTGFATELHPDRDQYLDQVVDVLLAGLVAPTPPPRRNRRP